MNNNLLDQLPAGEQSIASKLSDSAQDMKVSPAFQWDLENQLMEKYKNRTQPSGWFTKLTPALGWAFVAVCAVFVLNWMLRSLVPGLSAASGEAPTPQITFEDQVRAGNICPGSLALAHNFSVALTNEDKTKFIPLDEQETIGELRALAWSPDGAQLAIIGNTTGQGNIYLTDSTGDALQPVLANSPLGYLMDVTWSWDGRQLLTWSVQNNTIVYLITLDGSGPTEIKLGMHLFGTPQFSPDGRSIIFPGAETSTYGLFEFALDGSQTRLISSLVENASAFAWSPDGTQLAYFLADRTLGEALLVAESFNSGEKTVLATLPIPKGSGSSIPDVANLNWSLDGTKIVFEFGRNASDRVVYLAYADGSGLVELANSAHAPTISADGNCLAYISNKKVLLVDLTGVSLNSPPPTPLLLADLPAGKSSTADFRLDQLKWKP
jgi:Tol biopolymer transport system component